MSHTIAAGRDTADERVHRFLGVRTYGAVDGLRATNRKEPDRLEASGFGRVPIDRLAEIAPACCISRARVVDSGRIVTAGGIVSGMELGFHLLRRAGYSEQVLAEIARVMEYRRAYELYREDIEIGPNERRANSTGTVA